MDWLDRLNGTLGRIALGHGKAELVHWAHEAHLADNRPHRHTYFEACLVGRYGEGVFTDRGTDHPLKPGTLFLARPGAIHQIRNSATPEMELTWICFAWSADDAATNDSDRLMRAFAAGDQTVAEDDGRLAALWNALRAVASEPGVREQFESLARSLILAIAQCLTPEAPADEPHDRGNAIARLAVRYLEDNLNRPLSVPEIARHANVSERHLARLFAAYTGTSPVQYLRQARLDRASALLRRTSLPIKEIAFETGFGDVQYLTRRFTEHFGVSPARFREGERSGRIRQTDGALV